MLDPQTTPIEEAGRRLEVERPAPFEHAIGNMQRAREPLLLGHPGELRAVQPAFPLYGTLTLRDGATYSHDLLRNQGVLVRPELLTTLGIAVGD